MLTAKPADLVPAGIVTVDGTAANPELVVTFTANPELPALFEIVTVPVHAFPPITDEGLSDTLLIV